MKKSIIKKLVKDHLDVDLSDDRSTDWLVHHDVESGAIRALVEAAFEAGAASSTPVHPDMPGIGLTREVRAGDRVARR